MDHQLPLKQSAAQLFQQQKFEQALDTCRQYCKKAKKDPEGFFLLGSIHGALENMDEAIGAFKKAIKIRSDIPQLHFNLGVAQQKTGDLESARHSLERAIRLKPDFFEAHYNLADVLRELGFEQEAYDAYLRVTKINPGFPQVYMDIGNILRGWDRLDEAIAHYKKTIEMAPNFDQVYVNLGVTYTQQENFDEAEQCFNKAISLNPRLARAYLQYGLMFNSRGDKQKASEWLQKSIQLDPSAFLAHYNMGVIQRQLDLLDDAAVSLQRSIELNPKYIPAYIALAGIQRDLGALDRAMETMEKGLVYNPMLPEFYSELGQLMGARGNFIASIEQYKKAVELAPEDPKTHLGLGFGYSNMNQYDNALQSFEKAIQSAENEEGTLQNAIAGMAHIYERRREYQTAYDMIKPYLDTANNPRIALVFGSVAKKINMTEQAIPKMEQAINDPDIILEYKIELHFQLGKMYDGEKEYDRAFEHYKAGNEFFRSNSNDMIRRYSVEEEATRFKNIESVFTREFFETTPTSTCDSERPVFVVGMPRSGTTLTETILSNHAEMYGAGEMPDMAEIRKATEAETGIMFPDSMKHLSVETLDKLAAHFLSRLDLKSKTAKRVVDKMPHNFMMLGQIALLFPNAKIIHIQRFPVDNCLSIYFQRFNISHTYASDLEDLGKYYKLYLDMMDHWNEVLPVSILNIKYDELVANQEQVSRQMVAHCGLEWDENCMAFHKAKRDVGTPSYDQVSQPMYTKSSGRWQNYEKHIGILVETLEKNGSIERFEKALSGPN